MVGSRADRIRGMLLGLMAGDRGGGPTQMALRLAESLVERGAFETDDVATRYLRWWQRGGYDTGPVAARVFQLRVAGEATERAVAEVDRQLDGMTAGCNPAHRVAPLAASDLRVNEVAEAAAVEARLTHHHPLAGDVAAAVALLCRALLNGATWSDAVTDAAFGRLPETVSALRGNGRPLTASGFAPEVLRAAVHFVGTSARFAEALDRSSAFAGPANYAPTLVGALAGARWGASAIPFHYLRAGRTIGRMDRTARALAGGSDAVETMRPIAAVREAVAAAADGLGRPTTVDGALIVLPVLGPTSSRRYLTYAEAEDRRAFSIHEVHHGTVSKLQVSNRLPRDVLLLEGEIIRGLRQNRTLNATVLVPAGADVAIDVSCVERGRWSHPREAARRADVHLAPSVRSVKTESVVAATRVGLGARSDQHRVWEDIAQNLDRRGVRSPTSDFATTDRRLHCDRPRPADGQTGAIAVTGAGVASVDLFDHPSSLQTHWDALIAGYRADMWTGHSLDADPHPTARAWLLELVSGRITTTPSIGLGDSAQITTDHATGTALIARGAVVHLSAFPTRPRMMSHPTG